MSKKDKEFIQTTYSTPTIIRLSRKQVEQMAAMVNNFKDVDDFELHITNESGIGQSMQFKFTLDLAGDAKQVSIDATDVTKW
jgi:hypothetical protein